MKSSRPDRIPIAPEYSNLSPKSDALKNLIREPFLHFLLLGGLLFGFNAWRQMDSPAEDSGDSAQISVTADTIERLRAGYERQFSRRPGEEELRDLIAAHVREEVLCREALALGLDRDDTIVRRRLAQKMEFLTDDLVMGTAEPDETALEQYFTENAARYARAARVSFRHVFFSTERRGAEADAAAREALAALERGADDDSLGDSFLHGFEFAAREPEELAALFGPEFAEQLSAQPAGGWTGPVESSYGLHLVRVDARSEAAPVALDEVRETVMRDYNGDRRRTANREIFERLRDRYDVTVDEAALMKAAALATETAQR